jgi:hypothetical protein
MCTRAVPTVLLVVLLGLPLAAQEENGLLTPYRKSFARGSLSTKIQVLQDASNEDLQGMRPLYLQALRFYMDNISILENDATAIEMTKLSVTLIGKSGYTNAASPLWELFSAVDHTGIRVSVMNALGELLEPDHELVAKLERWLNEQNSSFRSGEEVDVQVLAEAVRTLGDIGSPSSFPVLFAAAHLGYPDRVSQASREALGSIEGDLTERVAAVIRQGFAGEKLSALEWALERDFFSKEQKGRIAHTALEAGLASSSNAAENKQLRELRYAAVRRLTELSWSEATPTVIEHFNRTVTEVERGIADEARLLEAISALGAMGTHEAAKRLTLYLEVLNSYVENGRSINERVALTVIRNLGRIGDRIAFDHVLYTRYLDYSRSVKEAAREVLQDLKQ